MKATDNKSKLDPLLSKIYTDIAQGDYEIALQKLKVFIKSKYATAQIYNAIAYCYLMLCKYNKSNIFAYKALSLDSDYGKAKLIINTLHKYYLDDESDVYELPFTQEDYYEDESEEDYFQRLHNINKSQIMRDYYLPSAPSLTPDPENGLFEGENLEEDWKGEYDQI